MPDSPATLAHDLITDLGRADALRYLAGRLWSDARPVLALTWAVVRG